MHRTTKALASFSSVSFPSASSPGAHHTGRCGVLLGSRVAVRLQYEAPGKIRSLYRSLASYLQNTTFPSGAEGIRTPDLRRAKAKEYILARTGAYSNFRCLQVFHRIAVGGSSIAYQPIPARLQYGCSTIYFRSHDGRRGKASRSVALLTGEKACHLEDPMIFGLELSLVSCIVTYQNILQMDTSLCT